jgi:hypothetical protein
MCHLQLHVQRVNASSHSSLMYEVLADQTMWAVCGRTAGRFIVSAEETTCSYSLKMEAIGSSQTLVSIY